MKRINQYERTNRDITNALLKLLSRKSLEKISVQEILDEAMVNRSTFYQHFPDKYAILEQLQEKLLSGMMDCIDACVKQNGWRLDCINTELYTYFAKNREQMRLLLSIRSENLDLEGQMKKMIIDYIWHSEAKLTALEIETLASITVSFISSFLNVEVDTQDLSEIMMRSWVHMTLFFFRVEGAKNAEDRFLALMTKMHKELRSPKDTTPASI